jgi:hypothetical protein
MRIAVLYRDGGKEERGRSGGRARERVDLGGAQRQIGARLQKHEECVVAESREAQRCQDEERQEKKSRRLRGSGAVRWGAAQRTRSILGFRTQTGAGAERTREAVGQSVSQPASSRMGGWIGKVGK